MSPKSGKASGQVPVLRGRCWLLTLVVIAASTTLGCGTSAPPEAPLRTDPATFVGRTRCATCHQGESQRWAGSHHDLAMQEASDSTVLGDFDGAAFRSDGAVTRFGRAADGGFTVNTPGPDGVPGDYRVAYTFGVAPLQQYLVETDGGRYQALTVAWDTRPAALGGQRWFDLYPDERIEPGEELHWTGSNLNWNYMCAECHSTGVEKNYDAVADRFDTVFTEIDVSCEACHGPGSNHVDWAEAVAAGAEIRFATPTGLAVDLSRGDPDWLIDAGTGLASRFPPLERNTQTEACGRCHARRSTQWDYEYGEDLTQTHRVALLDAPLYFADGQIRDEVYVYGSFKQSRMYAAGVECSDCHEPHRGDVVAQGNALCNQCHLAERFDSVDHTRHEVGTQGASCVDCHMPARTYMVIDDRRDHSFRVPRPDLSAPLGSPNACNACHTDRSSERAAAQVASWFPDSKNRAPHFGEALAAGRAGSAAAGADLIAVADDWGQPAIARATALSLLRRYSDGQSLQAIQRALNNADPLIRAAAVGALNNYEDAVRAQVAYPLLRDRDRSVRLQAARVLAGLPLAQLPELQRDTIIAAAEELIAALQLNAERFEFQMNLGVLFGELGRGPEAETAYRRAMQLDRSRVAARVNLADLYRGLGRDAEGEVLLREALAQRPEDADIHQALGLLLVRRGDREGAGDELERAWRLAPDNSVYGVTFALLLDSRGDLAGATAVLRELESRHPQDPQVLSALVQASQRAGDLRTALQYARRLREVVPGDRGVEQLVRDLEREIGA